MSLPERLKEARKACKLTQKEVAKQVGITESAYCGYETGKRSPDAIRIRQLAEVLHTTGDFLLETGFGASVHNKKTPTPETEDGRINLDELDNMTAESIQLLLALPEEKQRDAGSYIRYLATIEDK